MAATVAARRLFLGFGGTGTAAATYYKAVNDPPHLVWDLDNTILCSVSPHPSSESESSGDLFVNIFGVYSYPLESFDQIDDDFPFVENQPNTRTYWRPFARTALQFCNLFAIQHVYTTAQGTYTENILNQLDPDRTLFQTVIHRDVAPHSVKKGKDLELIIDTNSSETTTTEDDSSPATHSMMNRLILFDDRTKNFTPQNGENGVHVVPYEIKDEVSGSSQSHQDDNINSPKTPGQLPISFLLQEGKEVGRFVWISILALYTPDVRSILPYFRSPEHNKRFPQSSAAK